MQDLKKKETVDEVGGRRDSNPRRPVPQTGALPLNYAHHLNQSDPRGTRTPDQLLRRQLLYPAELPGRPCLRTNFRDDWI
jgi:hypothetical protein